MEPRQQIRTKYYSVCMQTKVEEDDALPQRILCEKCGSILYEGMDLKPPYEIVRRYNGKCPECGRKLFSDPINVEVKKIEQSVSV